jgi:signal transduction histidine kinase
MELSRSRRGLQKKFVASLLIVGFSPGIVALFATYLYSIQTIKTSIGSSFQQIAASTARRIEVMIDDEIDSARHLAATPFTVRGAVEASNESYRTEAPQAVRARLLRRSAQWERYRAGTERVLPSYINRETLTYIRDWFAIRAGEYQNVLVTDAHGALVASVAPTVGYQHGDEPWWREAFADGRGRLFVSDLYKQPAGEYLLDFAVPIMDRTGKLAIGVVKLELRRANIMKAIMEIKVGDRGHGMLLNTEGTPLICPVLPPKAHLINDPLMQQLMQATPGWVVAEDDAHGGHNSIVGYAPIQFTHPLAESSLGGHQWYAFVRQDPDETYAPVYALLRTVGMIGFGMVTVLASLGFFLGRLFVKPILMLQEQADAIRQGVQDLASAGRFDRALRSTAGRRVTVRTGDELESLALAFNQMAEALDESLKTIRNQENELLRKEKLASVGQLLAALAHDIKNPLGVIRSSAQLVLDDHQSEAVKREVAQYVIEEVDRLTNRINHFLRFARQKPPEARPVAVTVLLETALQEWRALGSGSSIAEEVRIASGVPDLMVDPDQVKEALVNLLINAREAMPQGGTLTITAGMEGTSGAPATVVVRIVDTGCGISPEHLQEIFGPFFTTKDFGTGLGLTNAKRLVEQNGGHLAINSQEGKGTEVVLRLPALNR